VPLWGERWQITEAGSNESQWQKPMKMRKKMCNSNEKNEDTNNQMKWKYEICAKTEGLIEYVN